MRHCQLVLFDVPPKKMKDIYRDEFGDDLAAQELIKRGVGDRIMPGLKEWVFVCGEGKRDAQCRCGRWATQLCDEPVGKGKTCDIPICIQCTVRPYPGQDIDLCPFHATRRAELFESREVGDNR